MMLFQLQFHETKLECFFFTTDYINTKRKDAAYLRGIFYLGVLFISLICTDSIHCINHLYAICKAFHVFIIAIDYLCKTNYFFI